MNTLEKAGQFADKIVAIVGNGPKIPAKLPGRFVIALSFAAERFMAADMAFAIDGNFPEGFKGQKVTGLPTDAMDVFCYPCPYEQVEIGPNHVLELRNNLTSALRMAVELGAKKVEVYGVDVERYESMHNFPGFGLALGQVVAWADAQGVKVSMPDAAPGKALEE